MANHRKTETTAKLKKFYSNLSNAVKLTEIEYGQPVYEFDFTGGVHTSETYSILSSIFSKLSAEYLGTEYAQNRFKDGESYIVYCENVFWNLDSYMLPDGTLLGSESGHDEYLLVDINGEKGPNVCGRDIFGFNIGIGNICSHSKNKSLCFPQKDKNIQTTREELITSCADGQSPVGCTKLIADDGWEIKDDYPIRL